MTVLRGARPSDLDEVLGLLDACGLPRDGVPDQFPDAYHVLDEDGLVGVAGLERHGEVGLLRSVAIHPAHQRSRLGGKLVTAVLKHADAVGVHTIFLLTTDRQAFFAKHGFTPVPRDQAPAAVAQSVQFARCCPDTAVCMRRG